MKKIISIVLGVAALAACTKTSVSYEQPGEIALAPVTRANMTKAAITGATFPITNDMGVYAFYNAGKLKDTPKDQFLAGSAAYLEDVKFVNRAGSGNWGGDNGTSYYWPKTGSLVFAAYSPSVAELSYNEQKDEFSATSYVQSTDLSSTVDLLWSPMTAKSHDKTTAAVPMVFYHAMSWVTVQVVAANEKSNSQFKVKSVELNDIVNKGSFKTAGATITWTPSTTDKQTLTVFSDDRYKVVELPTTEKPVQALENNAKGTVVIPQTLNDVTLTVVFSQLMPTGSWSADQNLTFKLNECKAGDPAVALNEWKNGKHYIYTLNFNVKGATGENEILIAPNLKDWEDVTASGINAQ